MSDSINVLLVPAVPQQDVKSQGADPELVSLHQIRGNEN